LLNIELELPIKFVREIQDGDRISSSDRQSLDIQKELKR